MIKQYVEEKNIWKCCDEYLSAGIKQCPICGREHSNNNSFRRSNAKLKSSKQDALGCQKQATQTVSGDTSRYHITIERHGLRTLDDDNFIGGCKQLRDAIAELLEKKGDSEADGLLFEYIQIQSKFKKTVIRIQKA